MDTNDTSNMDIKESIAKAASEVIKEWTPYEGPQGGQGWQHSESDEVVYQEEKPGTGESGEESSDTDIALTTGDPRVRVDTPEEAVQALADFDESDYKYDYWEGDGEVSVGSIVEIPTDVFQLQGDGDTAIVVEADKESGGYRVMTEDGVGYEFTPEVMGFDETGEGETSMLGVWDDPANQVATGESEWSDFSDDAIPNEVKEALGETESEQTEEEPEESQGDPDWFESIDFESYSSDNGLFSGGKYSFRGEVITLDEAGEARGVQYFDSEGVHNTFAEIDGVATTVSEQSSVDTGTIRNIHFSEDTDMEDGWYRIGDDTRVEDGGDSIFVEFEDQNGNITEIDAVEVEREQLIDRKHIPAEIGDATPSMEKPWENYEREYPEKPDLPDHLNTGNITEENGYTAESIKSINSGLGRVADLGLDRQISSIEVLDEEGTLGRFDPNTDQVLLNPRQMNQEQLDDLSENFSVGETVEDLVAHEAMHAAHVEALLEDEWSVDEIFDELLNKPLNESEKEIMERDVSTYGASNALEVVAEVGLAITMGKEVSDEALFIYEKYGGPEL